MLPLAALNSQYIVSSAFSRKILLAKIKISLQEYDKGN